MVGTIQGDFAVLSIGEDGGARVGLQSIMVKQLLKSNANNLQGKCYHFRRLVAIQCANNYVKVRPF